MADYDSDDDEYAILFDLLGRGLDRMKPWLNSKERNLETVDYCEIEAAIR